MKQGADLLDKPSIVYKTESVIRGVAIHVASAQLFVSTSSGYVKRTSIVKPSEPSIILSPDRMNFKPLTLSVDWLNLHLYVLGEVKHATTVWQIARCHLDGRGLTVAMAGLITKPSHVEVDPYNGYLFWVTRGGLYRLDLADISNGVKHEVSIIFPYACTFLCYPNDTKFKGFLSFNNLNYTFIYDSRHLNSVLINIVPTLISIS